MTRTSSKKADVIRVVLQRFCLTREAVTNKLRITRKSVIFYPGFLTLNGFRTTSYFLDLELVFPSVTTNRTCGTCTRSPPCLLNSLLLASSRAYTQCIRSPTVKRLHFTASSARLGQLGYKYLEAVKSRKESLSLRKSNTPLDVFS